MILTIGYLLILLISTIYNIPIFYSNNCSVIIPDYYYKTITNFTKFREDLIELNITLEECDIIIDNKSKERTFAFKYVKETFSYKIYDYFYSLGLTISELNKIYLLAYFTAKVMYLRNKNNENKILIDENTKKYNYNKDETNTCAICIEDYQNNDMIRELNCKHFYHEKCIDRWLLGKRKLTCPLCIRQVY